MKSALLCVALCVVGASCLSLNKVSEWVDLTSLHTKDLGDIWTNCSQPTDPLRIESVTLSPDPPVKGKNLTISTTVKFLEEVTSGSIAIKVKAGISFDKTLDLCEEASSAGNSCPIKAGSLTFDATVAIPSIPFKVHVTGTVVVTDQNKKELACVKLDFEI